MSQSKPIGIFDSGIGGLSIALRVRETIPNENILYVADSKHAPYGNKTPEFIAQRALAISQFLVENGAKVIVVACNTATVSTIHHLRAKYSLPIVGVEPGVKPATENSKTGIVGILATEHTLNSKSFQQLIQRFSSNAKIEIQSCPEFVEQVEKSDLTSQNTQKLVDQYIQPLLKKGADTIVLGCTHYPFLMPLIKKSVGENISVIDTGIAVAKEVARRLRIENILSTSTDLGNEEFYSTGNPVDVKKVIVNLWGKEIDVSPIDL